LTLIQPGVQVNTTRQEAVGAAGTWISTNGLPPRSNNFTLDGAIINNQYGTGANSIAGNTLGVDGIKEYRVVTNNFSAEYGLTTGSQMVIVSKGGSNRWHGDVFEYLRNNHLDARNFFEAQPSLLGGQRLSQFKRNNFGAAFAGRSAKTRRSSTSCMRACGRRSKTHSGYDASRCVPLCDCYTHRRRYAAKRNHRCGPIPAGTILPAGFSAANQQISMGV